MKARFIIIVGFAVIATVAFYLLLRPRPSSPSQQSASLPQTRGRANRSHFARPTNALGDILADAEDPVFLKEVFPKFGQFIATLDRLGVNPLQHELRPAACTKIQLTTIPDGIMSRFVIGDGWTARYTQNPSFSGITHFGQRGPDNPYRAISQADTNAVSRLSQSAIRMSDADVWRIANSVADAFGIDPSKFEKPEMYEEGLFEYRLGIYTVRYRKKGSDPINQLNYTRDFSLKATSPTTAVLVSYSHFEATSP